MKVDVKKPGSPGDILEHHGIKGMKWGVRKASSAGSAVGRAAGRTGRRIGRAASDAAFVLNAPNVHTAIATHASEKLMKDLPRIKAKHSSSTLGSRIKNPLSKESRAYRADVRKAYTRHLESAANSMTSGTGRLRYTLKENGKPNTSSYFWDVHVERVQHQATGVVKVQPIFDEDGWIVDFKIVTDEIAQTMDRGINFLIHAGIDV